MTQAAVEFRTLGPIELHVGGQPVPLGGPKQRTLLALLLLAEGRVVSDDRLVDELWGGQPPPSAVTALQVYVSGLRKVVGSRLRRAAGGYALDVTDVAEVCDRVLLAPKSFSEFPKNRFA